MDAPLGITSQRYAPAVDDPFLTSISSPDKLPCLDQPLYGDGYGDKHCESLPHRLDRDSLISQWVVQDLLNGSFNASPALFNSSVMCAPAAQSNCKLQPCQYSPSPSLNITSYAPTQVVELQCFPGDELLHNDMVAPDVNVPTLDAEFAGPVILPCHPFSSYADMLLNAGAVQNPSAASLAPSSYQFDADSNVGWCKGKQSQDPHDEFTFSFSHMEAKHQNQLPDYDVLHSRPELAASPNNVALPHHSNPQKSMKSWLHKFDVSTSHTACVTESSPAYMQSNIFTPAVDSDSAAMEMWSSSASLNSSFFLTSTLPESGSPPASPTPSVNKGTSTRRSSCDGVTSKVAVKVKTTLLNLHDGFKWKKYGEKKIMQHKFPRSYFRCHASDRCGCEIVKHTQKCDDEEHVLFTYLGRHNHT